MNKHYNVENLFILGAVITATVVIITFVRRCGKTKEM